MNSNIESNEYIETIISLTDRTNSNCQYDIDEIIIALKNLRDKIYIERISKQIQSSKDNKYLEKMIKQLDYKIKDLELIQFTNQDNDDNNEYKYKNEIKMKLKEYTDNVRKEVFEILESLLFLAKDC